MNQKENIQHTPFGCADCADKHGDQALDPLELEVERLRAGVRNIRTLWGDEIEDFNDFRAEAKEALRAAVEAEREECARIAEAAGSLFNASSAFDSTPSSAMRGMDAAANMRAQSIAIAIRARGGK